MKSAKLKPTSTWTLCSPDQATSSIQRFKGPTLSSGSGRLVPVIRSARYGMPALCTVREGNLRSDLGESAESSQHSNIVVMLWSVELRFELSLISAHLIHELRAAREYLSGVG